MKKLISLFIILMLIFTLTFSLVACGEDNPTDDPSEGDNPPETDEPDVPGIDEGWEGPIIPLPEF